MLVGICDFPGDYAFPPAGYGGIERWLWAVAVGAKQAGADVHLLGPQWRSDLANDWTLHPARLEDLSPRGRTTKALRANGYDLLVVGHEYPSLPAWRAVADTLGAEIATFQHWPYFEHRPDAFDGLRSRLYTYSDEMHARYAAHHPTRELAVHLEVGGRAACATGRADQQFQPDSSDQWTGHSKVAKLADPLAGRTTGHGRSSAAATLLPGDACEVGLKLAFFLPPQSFDVGDQLVLADGHLLLGPVE